MKVEVNCPASPALAVVGRLVGHFPTTTTTLPRGLAAIDLARTAETEGRSQWDLPEFKENRKESVT